MVLGLRARLECRAGAEARVADLGGARAEALHRGARGQAGPAQRRAQALAHARHAPREARPRGGVSEARVTPWPEPKHLCVWRGAGGAASRRKHVERRAKFIFNHMRLSEK
jgi:hypothetical protein